MSLVNVSRECARECAVAAAAIAVAAVALTRNGSLKIHAWRSAVLFN